MSVAVPFHPSRPERRVLADLVPGAIVRDIALVVAGAGLTGLAAQVSVHVPSLTPVPFTLQTLAVLLTGAALGSLRGVASMGLYMVAGIAGVPWFEHGTSGFAGVSFGYIIGFVLAAGLVGELARRGNDRSVVGALGLLAAGDALLLVVGMLWLKVDLHISLAKAIEYGITPFVIGDAIKLAVAAGLLPTAWKLVGRR